MSDVSTDWTVDPVLEQNCRKVVEKSICSTYPANKVLECLVNLLSVDSGNEGSIMTDDCETTLIQIQYFMAREFTIDSSLYESCGKEAREICHAKVQCGNLNYCVLTSIKCTCYKNMLNFFVCYIVGRLGGRSEQP
jgi:hypothetical protein